MYRMHHYPPHLSTRKLAGGASYPWYPASVLNSATPLAPLGAMWELQGDTEVGGGNTFMYVKAGAALTKGQTVAFKSVTAGAFTASGSTVQSLITDIDTTSLGNLVGCWLYIKSSGAAGPVLRRIKSHTTGANATFVISTKDPNSPAGAADVDALAELPTNGDKITIIYPYTVIVGTASLAPVGIVMADVDSGKYTIIQVAGLGLATVTGHASLAADLPLTTAASGKLTYGASLSVALGAAVFRPKFAWTTASDALVPVEFSCVGNL